MQHRRMPCLVAACLSAVLLAACTSLEDPAPPAAAEAPALAALPSPPLRAAPDATPAPAPVVTLPPPVVGPAPAAKPPPMAAPRPTPSIVKPEPPATVVQPPPARPALDLASLETRLKQTPGLGIFTKLALKNQIDDLLAALRTHHRGGVKSSIVPLQRSYELLLLKVLALLKETDPPLAGAIADSRDAIWAVLSNPAKFASVSTP